MSPAAEGEAKCFAVRRGDLDRRLDAHYHGPRYANLSESLARCPFDKTQLGVVSPSIVGGATPAIADSELYAQTGPKFLRIVNVTEFGIDLTEVKHISDAVNAGALCRSRLARNDVLMTITGRVGTAAVVPDDILPANINQHIVRLRIEHSGCLPEYLAAYLNSSVGAGLSNRPVTGGTRIALDYGAIRHLSVPLPPLDIQHALVVEMETAREARRRRLQEADALLTGIDAYLLAQLGIKSVAQSNRTGFAVRARQIKGPMNPDRYLSRALENSIRGTTIGEVAQILEDKVNPRIEGPEAEWDWIRIDDLCNEPLEVETIRTEVGADIQGALFAVQENDVLLARLGPTILNRKFVLCPKTGRRTVASGEFLVLRCSEHWDPVVVLWVLRTSVFRDLIYSKGRGATPSRYRVNRDDLRALPFPMIDAKQQRSLMKQISDCIAKARRLRAEAVGEWEAAKARFEEKLLGGGRRRGLPEIGVHRC